MLARTAIFLVLISVPAVAADVSRKVPDKFIGDWCTEPLPQEEDTGESDIRISQREIGYYRESGKILAAAAVGDQLTLIVELKVDNFTSLGTHEFEISEDGTRITTVREDGQIRTRVKCQF